MAGDVAGETLTPKVIGWREWIALPDFKLYQLRAKIDTGARTAALYAADMEYQMVGDIEHVSFSLPFDENRRIFCPVQGRRRVRNTSGVSETRTVVRTTMVLGCSQWAVDVALSNRKNMLNPIILGRTAVRGRKLTINPGRSFLQGLPTLEGENK